MDSASHYASSGFGSQENHQAGQTQSQSVPLQTSTQAGQTVGGASSQANAVAPPATQQTLTFLPPIVLPTPTALAAASADQTPFMFLAPFIPQVTGAGSAVAPPALVAPPWRTLLPQSQQGSTNPSDVPADFEGSIVQLFDRTCRICGRLFGRPANAQRHIDSVHLALRPFTCPHPGCGRTFSQETHMRNHFQVSH